MRWCMMLGRKPNIILVGGGSQTHHHSHQKNVTEQKAPTDESMRLLKEFQEKAIDSVVEAGTIEVASIEGDIAFMRRHDAFYEVIHFRVVLNGKKIEGSYQIEGKPTIDLLPEIVERVARVIARELIAKGNIQVVLNGH